MNYVAALEYLYNHLPMFQRLGPAAYKNSLDNTLALDRMLGHPHRGFKSVHVAGTNGKGSVSHMLASVLQEAGFRTGLYTSPHLNDFRERIKVNGKMIGTDAVAGFVTKFVRKNKDLKLSPSFFELTVAMAFEYFRDSKVDIAVVEVGLGGRLDSTNIITPEISVITNISLDHTNLLGNTIEKIAIEKAGIIKENIPVIIGETQPETEELFSRVALEKNSAICFADRDYLPLQNIDTSYTVTSECNVLYRNIMPDLKGAYQEKNILTAVAAIECLKQKGYNIPVCAVVNGLGNVIKNTGLFGRWQVIGLSPKIICDTAHNVGGLKWVVNQLEKERKGKLHVVFGMVNDKETGPVLDLLPKHANYYFTRAQVERAMDEKLLKEKARQHLLYGNCYPTVKEAIEEARKNSSENDLIFIGGSTFIVAEAL
ncbi:MAG: bifunctional folylpolyglutamate synthase/dihydrofolate synthase [Prolixibacteraceae bacterium]|nr:bifunctional folylpolyglutamate synthase/dihydrofolate synthase [Prolixibacteraceae bacterium]